MQSQELESVLRNSFGGAEDLMLGELQFSFIAFLVCTLAQCDVEYLNVVENTSFFQILKHVISSYSNMKTWVWWNQMGQSLEAFGQWKAIVSLLFSCEESVSICIVCVQCGQQVSP